ncbi:MAG: hypothetical protein E6R13_04165 [Spirochaetes bacterium]|nr:MAG: hypothetical protein E6R13_04165 [Spirochaetota bacterium]
MTETEVLNLETYLNVVQMCKATEDDINMAGRVLINMNTPLPILQLICKKFTGSRRANIVQSLCETGKYVKDNFADAELTFDSIKFNIMSDIDYLNDSFIREVYELELTSFVDGILKSFSTTVDGITVKTNWNVTNNS